MKTALFKWMRNITKQLRFSLSAIVVLSLMSSGPIWAQTSPILETFTNLGPYGGYQTETWTGDNGGTWTATDARTDQNINGKAITVRDGELTSPIVSGGIGSLTVTTQRVFSGGSGVVDVLVNGVSVGTVPYDVTVLTSTISNINLAGSVIVKLVTPGNGDRVAIDDLQWTAFSTTNPYITALPSNLSGLDYDLGAGPSASQSFDVSGMNLDLGGDVELQAGTYFELSEDNVNFSSALVLIYPGVSLPPQPIYVRLISGLSAGDYTEQITISGGGAPNINVNVDGSVTVPIPAPDLIISEVADPGDDDQARFVEIFNNGNTTIDFANTTVFLTRYANANTNPQTVQLTGSLIPGDFYVIADNMINFNTAYGINADLESGIITGNGDDTYALYIGGDWDSGGTMFEIYGEIGVDGSGEAWEYEDSRAIRNDLSLSPNNIWTSSEWTITTANVVDMTPGQAETSATYTYNGTTWSPANPNGNTTASDNIIVQSGAADFTQDISVNNITINAGAILNIEQALMVNGNIINNGSLVFINDATKLGQLGKFYGTISGSGETTVQRYVPGRRAFRFVSSAVTTTTTINANWQEGVNNTGTNYPADNLDPNSGFGTHITGSTTGANGFDATISGNPSLMDFDNAGQAWNFVPNTNLLTLAAGKAYNLFVRGDRSIDLTNNTTTPTNTTLRATGGLHVGDYTDPNLSQVAGKFNFIGNPYQAIVDMNKVLENSTNINDGYYWIWDPTESTSGSYVLVNLPDGLATPSASDANQFLQPGQAAFVVTLSAGAASILFEESDKNVAAEPTDVFKPFSQANIALNMYEAGNFINNGPVADGFLVKFSPGENNAVDFRDALKWFNPDENITLTNNGNFLIMENRDLPTSGEVLQLYNNNYRHSNYTFKIEVNGFDNYTVYLNDNYLGTQTQLASGTNQIDFSVDQNNDPSTASDRFYLSFQKLSIEKQSLAGFVVYPNPVSDTSFKISSPGFSGKANLALYDVLGRKVHKEKADFSIENKIEVITDKLRTGIYTLKLETELGKSFAQKLIVE